MYQLPAVLVLAALFMAFPVRAQILPEQQSLGDVTWTVETKPQPARPGEWLMVRFAFAIDPGWHLYAMDSPAGKPLQITFEELPEGFRLNEPLRQSPPLEGYDPNFRQDVRYFEEKAEVLAGFSIADTVRADLYTLRGKVRYMICNDRMCLPPRSKPFSITVDVDPGPPRPAFLVPSWDGAGSPESETAITAAPINRGGAGLDTGQAGRLLPFLLLAIGAGLGSLLMPCIFPMIPLTVSYFTQHADDHSAAMRMAGFYGLTIVLTFTGLGLVTTLLIGAAGAQSMAANPWVNVFIGLMLVIFGLSLLGLFELRLPSNLANYLNRQSNRRGGIAGVFFMGLTLTVVSFTCTAPFVGTLLAAAAGGTWTFPLLGMMIYSATFALPFVLLAIFPRGLSALPKSGAWMNTLKVTFGFVELAAALKFFSNADLVWNWHLLSRPLAITLTVVILSLAGLYLLGKLRMEYEPAVEHVGVGRLLAAIAFFGLSLYLLPGLFGASLGRFDAYLPPRQATDAGLLTTALDASGDQDNLAWHDDDLEAALAEAQQSGKPVLVDFTGYTCTNCREMEANVFPQEQVARHLRRDFVLLRLYTDAAETGTRWQRYQLDLTGTVALPTYAIITPDEELLTQWSGIASVEAFVTFLEQGLAAFNSRREPYPGKASF